MKVVVVVAVLLTTTLARAKSAQLDPPPGWIEDTSGGAEHLAKMRKTAGIARAELRLWNAPTGDASFMVIELEATTDEPKTAGMIDGMETGAIRAASSGRQLSLTRREEGHTTIVDQVVETADRRLHFRRHYAVDARGTIHNVIATCGGPVGADEPPACTKAMAGFRWLVEPVELEPKYTAIAYRIGQLIGYGLIAAFGVWLVVRLSRKKQPT